jgi:predicted DNA-binding transcriptional regulator YafY
MKGGGLMKIDRLLGIITVLLQKGHSTAPELAKRFEVSSRTIFRDVEDICKAGIPLVTMQGGGGGISIAEGYRLNHSALTADELQTILAGLKSLGSVSDEPRLERLISKLTPGRQAVVSMKDSIVIDLASHYKASLSEKIALIKSAIAASRLVRFDYYSERGRAPRIIEPYFIAFKWSAWYVFGFCMDRKDFRLFKLNRLWNVEMLSVAFEPREIPEDGTDLDDYFDGASTATVLFDKSAEYLIVEEYGPESYEELADGRLKLTLKYTNEKYIRRWLLGFGDSAVVLEPPELADEIGKTVNSMKSNYRLDI